MSFETAPFSSFRPSVRDQVIDRHAGAYESARAFRYLLTDRLDGHRLRSSAELPKHCMPDLIMLPAAHMVSNGVTGLKPLARSLLRLATTNTIAQRDGPLS